jgi:hypothetical protein
MKLKQVLLARAVRQVAAIQLLEPRADTVKKLQERYSFAKVPTTYEELYPTDPAQGGLRFLQGKFECDGQAIAVDLHLLANLIIGDTRGSTDHSDLFLDEYIGNANATRSDVIMYIGPRLYVSQIEFTTEQSLETLVSPSVPAAARNLDRLVADSGAKASPFGVHAVTLNFDPTGLAQPVPSHFSVERRVGLPYSLNTYFSNAPLKTSEHVKLLETIFTD